jgi:hypothetical protein
MTEADRVALETRLAAMTEQEVARAYNAAAVESEEADIIAGEMERRDIGD